MFETHVCNIYRYVIETIDREHTSFRELVGENIPCRITRNTRTSYEARLYISKKYVDKIKVFPRKNFEVEIIDKDYIQQYTIGNEPIWSGGVKHHLEMDLKESV